MLLLLLRVAHQLAQQVRGVEGVRLLLPTWPRRGGSGLGGRAWLSLRLLGLVLGSLVLLLVQLVGLIVLRVYLAVLGLVCLLLALLELLLLWVLLMLLVA